MNKRSVAFGFLAVLGFFVLAAPASSAFDWAGTWTGTIDTGGMGVDTITLVISKADKTYTGTMSDSLGLIDKNVAITDVKFDSTEITFSFKAAGGSMDFLMKISAHDGKISAQLMNKAVGEWGSFANFSRKGEPAQKRGALFVF
jgi:hypothetical protein